MPKVILPIRSAPGKRVSLFILMLFALVACKPGRYYPFGGDPNQVKTSNSVEHPAKPAHDIKMTDIIAS